MFNNYKRTKSFEFTGINLENFRWKKSTGIVLLFLLIYFVDVNPVFGCGLTAPSADFSTPTTAPVVGQSVTFTDNSDPGDFTITAWDWNFGSGASPGTATGKGPHTIIYTTTGSKDVSLTVHFNYNGDRTDNTTKYGYVNVSAANPTITVSTTSLTAFANTCAGSNSTQQSYTVSGSNLTGNIVITPPGGFQISTTSGSGFTTSPITLTQTGGAVATTTIYARFSPATAGAASGNITHTSAGATQKDVGISGTGVALPACSINGADAVCAGSTGNSFTGPAGMASYAWSISGGTGTVVGASNTQTVTVTAGTGASFTLSLTINDGACSNTCQKNVTINALPAATVGANDRSNISCYAGTNGSITITASGGAGPYHFSLDNGGTYTTGTNPNPYKFENLSAGTYYPRVIDANNCQSASCQ